MKLSKATNRLRKKEAEQRRGRETLLSPRRLSHLTPEEQEKAKQLIFYLQQGYLQDPDQVNEEENLEAFEEGTE